MSEGGFNVTVNSFKDLDGNCFRIKCRLNIVDKPVSISLCSLTTARANLTSNCDKFALRSAELSFSTIKSLGTLRADNSLSLKYFTSSTSPRFCAPGNVSILDALLSFLVGTK